MKFSIRDLLWLTALCAVVALAYNDRLKTQRRIVEAEAEQAQEKVVLEKSRAELERQRQLQKTELDQRVASVRLLEDEIKVGLKAMKEAQALDEEYRRRLPQLFDPTRTSSFPKRTK